MLWFMAAFARRVAASRAKEEAKGDGFAEREGAGKGEERRGKEKQAKRAEKQEKN